MSSGSYTSSPAAGSKALCGVRFFPLPCAFSAGAGGAFGFYFFQLPLPPIAGVVWGRDATRTRRLIDYSRRAVKNLACLRYSPSGGS